MNTEQLTTPVPSSTPGYEKERVNSETAIQKIDWHRHEYPLGVRTSLTESLPTYNALSAMELEILHRLLTTVLPGCERTAAQEFMGLSELATWARECAVWARRHP